MKVYAVIGFVNYHGYEEPIGIYDIYDEALEVKIKTELDGYDSVHIFSYYLNEDKNFERVL